MNVKQGIVSGGCRILLVIYVIKRLKATKNSEPLMEQYQEVG